MVLIVDDDESLGELLLEVLDVHDLAGEFVTTSRAAMARIQSQKPVDILVTDFMLDGGITGIDLCRECAAIQPGVHCVIMSGDLGDVEDRDLQGISPPPSLLQKPFGIDEFIGLVLGGNR